MSLQEEIDKTRQEIQTDGYSMSVGEWLNLYQDNEIDIHPDIQRFFRWSEHQKSTFIESIILGIPLPPIFVNQRNDGIWDVIDGLQRLSTIYEFVGILKDEKGNRFDPFVLQETTYLPSLSGKKWNDSGDRENSLTQTQRLLIKRAKIPVNILQKESDKMIKYELFQRLNAGGSIATPQEVRSCLVLMLNKDLFKMIRSLADNEKFKNCISLPERFYDEQYDIELVLRFILFFSEDEKELKGLGDVNVFLTEKARKIATKIDLDTMLSLEETFNKTFELLSQEMGDDSFKRYDAENKKFSGGFSLAAYETIALGIGYNSKNLLPSGEIRSKIQKIWSDKIYKQWSGSGVKAEKRLPYLIPLGRKIFSPS
ncbi:MAG: DUF262 domain-containing protein [Cyanobacteria bacterium SBLK]|nr:DUF262 domain-containing protein [Cyanobacteria bacterium SBLK]